MTIKAKGYTLHEENVVKTQLVQMRLKQKTLELIESLSKMTENNNRTQIVAFSIQMAEEIVKNIEAGNKVYIEDKEGKKAILNLLGL